MDVAVGIRVENNHEFLPPKTDKLITTRHKRPEDLPKTPETIHNNSELLRRHIYRNFKEAYLEIGATPPEIIPESLVHIEQVSLVAECIAGDTARMYGYTHDIGRLRDVEALLHDATLTDKKNKLYNSNNHPLAGNFILRSEQFHELYSLFALDHHQMGLGFPIVGRPSVKQIIVGGDGLIGTRSVEEIPEADILKGIHHIDALYGAAGIAAILADLSKAYTIQNGVASNRPTIAAFSKENAQLLIERLLLKGDMKEGDERHKTELLGVRYILRMIDFLKESYGIDYGNAIQEAQRRWEGTKNAEPAVKDKIQQQWNQTIAKPLVIPIPITRTVEDAVAADDK